MTLEVSSQKKNESFRKVVRINERAYDRLKTAADIKHIPLSKANEIAILAYADFVEYSPENAIEKLAKQPFLKIYQEQISKMLKNADIETLEAIVKIFKEGQVAYYESKKEEIESLIEKINIAPCKKITIIVRIPEIIENIEENIDEQIDKIFASFKKISCIRDEQILIDETLDEKKGIIVSVFILKELNSEENQSS